MSHDVPVVRSIVSVAAGFLYGDGARRGGGLILAQASPTLVIKLAYETLFALLAGYITARIAVRKPYLACAG